MLAFLKQNIRWIAGGFTLTFFSSVGQTYFISASISEWQAAFDLSHGEFGRLYMFATLASAACLPFIGRLLDVVKPDRIIAMVIPILAAGALLAAYATSVTVLIGAIFLLRLFGQGMMTQIALTTTGRWFVAQRGRAVSLVVLGHHGGEASIPLAFAALTIAYGYRMGWTIAAIVLIVVGLPFAFWCYHKPRVPLGQRSSEELALPTVRSWTRREVLRDPIFWLLLTGVLAPAFIGTTIFYHQNYLTELREWPQHIFAASLAIMALTTVVCALFAGAAIDRFGARTVLPYFLLPLASACFVLGANETETTLYFVMVLLGVSAGISSTLFGSLWPDIYGTENLGGIRAITVSAAVLSTAAGPGLTGTLIDRGIDLPVQLMFLGGYCLLAAGTMTIASIALRRRTS